MYKPVVLVILDGWGISNNSQGNIIKRAKVPTIDKFNKFYPMTTLQASGISVGIPWGEPGNSEVGHTVLGAGRIIYQNLPRITLAIQDRTFFKNESLLKAIKNVKENKSSLHLMGLLGEGSVHSSIDHLYALIELAKEHQLRNVFIHVFTDGRDCSPKAGVKLIQNLQSKLDIFQTGKIASLCGRNWAMDRKNDWKNIEKAYQMLTEGTGEKIQDPTKYLEDSYDKGVTDEYIEPAIIEENGNLPGLIKDNDSIIFFNFREDRARELTKAFVLPGFEKFPRNKRLKLEFITMTEYEKDLPVDVAFAPIDIANGLGEILSKNKKKQFRIAETEKHAHVTYFFNGGKEKSWPGEDRVLVPSPAVSKYEETPEMSADKITEHVVEAIQSKQYDFILINYANADMIGHTGNEEACIEAVESINTNMSILVPEVLKAKGCLLITADHGNIEEIKNTYTGEIDTEHSTNPVPLWFITPDNHREKTLEQMLMNQNEVGGLLSDIAPTILDIMGIEPPKEMTGSSLLPILE